MRKAVSFILAAMIFFMVFAMDIHSQTTEFVFQGRLLHSSIAANGNYDMEFELFDAVLGGSSFGPVLSRSAVPVSGGIFAVNLDFGDVFPGAERFLEIRLRQTGMPVYETLTPRQKVSSHPYSVKSLNSDTANIASNATQLGGVDASEFVVTTDPRMSDARTPTAGSADYIQNSVTQQASSNFNISGQGAANILSATSHFELSGFRVASILPTQSGTFFGRGAGQANTTGGGATFFGAFAGSQNTTGNGNAFFGAGAGNQNQTGGTNSYFGALAGEIGISASNNSMFGNAAGRSNQASYNSFFGSQSGFNNTTGERNAFFGAFAGNQNQTGDDNSFFGYFSGTSNTTGTGNSFFGSLSGLQATTGNSNSYFGSRAGLLNVSGTDNAMFGTNAGLNNTISFNSFFGSDAGRETTTGQHNTMMGARVGMNNVTGTRNSFFGSNAGFNSTASDNTIMGAFAGFNNTSGSFNSFFGSSAGSQNGTGNYNSFFGYDAGRVVSTGSQNSIFGARAAMVMQTGGSNSIFGMEAGVNLDNGDGNSFFGHRAGNQTTGGSSNGNTFIGLRAGEQNVGGGHNTMLGADSGTATGNLTFATAIGAGAIAATSNSVMLGRDADTVMAPNHLIVGPSTTKRGDLNLYANGNADFYMQAGGATTGINFAVVADSTLFISHYNGTSYQDRLVINPAGTVQINVLGAAGATTLCRNASNQIATCSSSLRYKTNVAEFRSGLDLIRRFRPVTFNWTADRSPDIGLVAEEVAAIEPLLAIYNEDGAVEGIKYDRIAVVLVNTIKEQQEMIESQGKEIRDRDQRLATLEMKLLELSRKLEAMQSLICGELNEKVRCP